LGIRFPNVGPIGQLPTNFKELNEELDNIIPKTKEGK